MRFFLTFGILGHTIMACDSDKSITTVNATPDANILSPQNGQSVSEGYVIEARGQVSDSNHPVESLQVAWFYGTEKVCDWQSPDNGGGTFCFITPDLDHTLIQLDVRDPEGASGSHAISIDVDPTEAPTVEILNPVGDGVYYSDKLIIFEGTAEDAEDDSNDLSVLWNSSVDGDLNIPDTVSNSGEFAGATLLSEGQHFVQVTVTDQSGKTGSDNVVITVGPPNSAPTCSITNPSDGTVGNLGQEVIFQGLVDDVDIAEDDLVVEWFSDKDGALGTSTPTSTGTVNFAFAALTVNTHNITMVVTDELGESCTAAVLYSIGSPPLVQILQPGLNQVINEGDMAVFEAQVSDVEDAASDLQLSWSLNGSVYQNTTANANGLAQWSDGNLSAGNYTLLVEATDSDGQMGSDQVVFSINARPTAPGIVIAPSSPFSSDGLTAQMPTPSTDPEGNALTYDYQWLRNGVIENGATTPTLAASMTNKGDVWTIEVSPFDGYAYGAVGSASVTIQNSPPVMNTVTISPNSTYNDGSITCSGTASDIDETVSPTFAWNINGQTYTQNPLTLTSAMAMPGDIIECIATVSDSDGATDSMTSNITVDNRNPVVTGPSISPSSLYANSLATCNYSSTDADGQPLTTLVQWFNGTNLMGTGDQLSLVGLASHGDSITCEVNSTDNYQGVTQSSAPVIVQNTAPTAPTAILTSTNAPDNPIAEIDDITCSVSPLSTDIDGDTLYYTFDWTDPNGTMIAGTPSTAASNTLSATTPTFEGTWTCAVSVSDGVAAGGSDSESIFVENGCNNGGTAVDCPGWDCAQILFDGESTGNGIYWIDPEMDGGAYEVYCLMDTAYDGGGWTLISVHSDDGQDTWSWDNRQYFDTDTSTFGSLNNLNLDFKSPALHDVGMEDILFIHAPSGVWAGYNDVDSGILDFGSFVAAIGGNHCYGDAVGHAMTSGTLTLSNMLESTDLYFNPKDADGGNHCSIGSPSNSHSYGPAWNAGQVFNDAGTIVNDPGPFNDPGMFAGLGPHSDHGTGWSATSSDEIASIGFGRSTLINTGSSGTGSNYMQVFVRKGYDDGDGDGVVSWLDCDDNNPNNSSESNGATLSCAAVSCQDIIADGWSLGDGRYWIDPDGTGPFQTQCDMSTNGGGWTLLMHNNTTLFYTELGDSGAFNEYFGQNLSYSRMDLGLDVMMDVNTDLIVGNNFQQRSIITNIASGTGLTLHQIFNGNTPIYLDDENNGNVQNIFASGYSCVDPLYANTTPYYNWGQVTCHEGVITLMDMNSCGNNFLIGGSTSHSVAWGNCAGWPQDLYHVSSIPHFPEVFRIWTR